MCRTTKSDSMSKTNDETMPDKKTENPSSEIITSANSFSLWCGCFGRQPVSSGRDLGVGESSLEDRAGIVSDWLMTYLTPLLHLGSVKVLAADDVGVPSKQDEAEYAFQETKKHWDAQAVKCHARNKQRKDDYQAKIVKCGTEQEREKIKKPEEELPSVSSAIIHGFGVWPIVTSTLYYLVSSVLMFVPVLILEDLVSFFEQGADFDSYDGIAYHPWIAVAGLAIFPVIVSLLQTRNQTVMAHCATFSRTAVSMLLYRKSLTVSAAGRAKTSTGQVVNMMSNDTAQLQRFIQFAGYTFSAPISIALALYMIYQQVGNATWVGVGYMILLAPVNVWLFSVVSDMRREVLKFSDLRVKMMNEILAGIRIIKFYGWERPFRKEVGRLRESELQALTKLAYVTSVGFSFLLLAAPIIQPILVFLTYVKIQDEPLSAAKAFTTVALFNVMRFPFAFLPMGFLNYIQCKISLHRLERYLDLPELSSYVEPTSPPDAEEGSAPTKPASITIQNGFFGWNDPDAAPIKPVHEERKPKKKKTKKSTDSDSSMNVSSHSSVSGISSVATESTSAAPIITLQNINCFIEAGSLVAVVGEVGSGKSSFLSAILGEMEPIQGSKVYIPRGETDEKIVTYCSQTPWVVNDTLRGNILFGREFDQERYDKVVEACALLDDLDVLPAGDMTEIGERGINLSGGQKARVSLARALYSKQSRLALLDDPLSAVDAHVGEHLFANAITGEISKGMTRILVTHHVHVLNRCDSVIVMERGTIRHLGKYQDLVEQGVDFAGAVDVSKAERASPTDAEDDSPDEKAADAATGKDTSKNGASKEKGNMGKKAGGLVSEEEREEGQVDGLAYIHYARAGGVFFAFAVFIIQGIGRASELANVFWLSVWAEEMVEADIEGDQLSSSRTSYYVGIYALFGIVGVFGLTARSWVMAIHRLRASRQLHDDLTGSIMRAPIAFFDVTPIGRVLNRFAADMDKLDLQLTQSLAQGISTIYNVIGALVAIAAATKGTFLVPLVPLAYMFYVIQKWFRKTSTELQRVTNIANSPIFADFSQTLSGTPTVRAFGESTRFFESVKQSFDHMNAAYVLTQLVNAWLGLRLDILGGVIGAIIGGIAVGTASQEFIPAGWLGLALAFSIEITGFLKHGVRMVATVEADMSSVERILYYSNNIPAEAPEELPDDPAQNEWPTRGEIEFKNASMRYRDGPLVLKNLSLKIRAGEKVGVCGRTGSGKSSLMIVLFRISEIEKDGGLVLIDGRNTAEIGTECLRQGLSIIPQDPVLFSNTIRYNLDPFGLASDSELWTVLQKVKMEEAIAALPNGLLEEVSEGGENFSQGQRQLLCIARALLRKPKILVLDEATASIDNTTDAAIQEMIRGNFADATVLTIAHRLNTIMDSDRVLVLDDGEVAEFDTPRALLAKEDGQFKAMVEKSRAAHSEGAQ